MPKWSGWDVPEGVETESRFHWFEVNPGRGLDLVVLSEEPYCYVGHFYEKRMWPCTAPHCGVCEDGIGRQVRLVFVVACTTTRRVGLIEISDSVGRLIRDWVPRHEGLRGMHLFFSKATHKKQSRTLVDYVEEGVAGWWRTAEVVDPEAALMCTWKRMKAEPARSSDTGSGGNGKTPHGTPPKDYHKVHSGH